MSSPPSSYVASGTEHTSPATSYTSNDALESTPVRRTAPFRRKSGRAPNPDAAEEWARCSREELIERLGALKQEKEELEDRIEEHATSLADISDQHHSLTRDNEMLEEQTRERDAQQARIEDELATRIETTDKLRTQLRESERSKRDLEKRYREQTATFEADRQSWHDSERHLQSRISSLSKTAVSARRKRKPAPQTLDEEDATPVFDEALESGDHAASAVPAVHVQSPSVASTRSSSPTPPPGDLLESLNEAREQYETLLTSHDSLNKSHELLQEEMAELKRINERLQDEQESYNVLLGERTLNGDFLAQGFLGKLGASTASSPTTSVSPWSERQASVFETSGSGSAVSGAVGAVPTKAKRKKRVEPVLGGMDLAAELDRADEVEAEVEEREAEADRERGRRASKGEELSTDVEALQSEVKMLRDANKALALYISRILDKLQVSGAFEMVWNAGEGAGLRSPRSPKVSDASSKTGRPTSVYYRPSPLPDRRRSADLGTGAILTHSPMPPPAVPASTAHKSLPVVPPTDRASKRMSLSAFATSLWTAKEKPSAPTGLKPMLLGTNGQVTGPAVPAPSGVRQLDNVEDDDDAQTRERLNAELRLHGFDPAAGQRQSKRANLPTPSLLARSPPQQGGVWSTDSSPSNLLPLSRSQSATSAKETVEEREKEQRAAMEQGKASGFTELKSSRRRPSSTSRQSSSTSSTGLGISMDATSPGSDSAASESKWTSKASKRMSSFWGQQQQ